MQVRGYILTTAWGVGGGEEGQEGVGCELARRRGAGAPRAPVRSAEAESAGDSKTSVMCHSPLLADCSWIKD